MTKSNESNLKIAILSFSLSCIYMLKLAVGDTKLLMAYTRTTYGAPTLSEISPGGLLEDPSENSSPAARAMSPPSVGITHPDQVAIQTTLELKRAPLDLDRSVLDAINFILQTDSGRIPVT